MQRLSETEEAGDEEFRKRLSDARKEFSTEDLAEQVSQADADRMQGRDQEAEKTDRETSQELQELSQRLEKERKRAVQAHLAKLAAAEAEAKQLVNLR